MKLGSIIFKKYHLFIGFPIVLFFLVKLLSFHEVGLKYDSFDEIISIIELVSVFAYLAFVVFLTPVGIIRAFKDGSYILGICGLIIMVIFMYAIWQSFSYVSHLGQPIDDLVYPF